jgi:hypothetical protein
LRNLRLRMRRTFFRKGHVTGVTSGHVTVVTSGQVTSGRDDDYVRFVLDQHAELDIFSASSLKQQSMGRHVNSLGHIYH